MPKYNFYNKLVLRTSLLPYTDIQAALLNSSYLENNIFLEALFISAPELFELYLADPENEQIKLTISKYFLRASFRTTPFGLYAGMNVIDWSAGEKKTIGLHGFKRVTKLDISCLDAICRSIMGNEMMKSVVKLYPNSSIYKVNNSYRYIEPHSLSQFQLSSFDYSSISKTILNFCRDGKTFPQIVDYLTASYPGEENAIKDFLQEMISAGILVYALIPQLIGTDPLEQIIVALEQTGTLHHSEEINSYVNDLKAITGLLSEIDIQRVQNRSNYLKLKQHIESVFGIKVPLHKLVNVSMFPAYTGGLDKSFQHPLIEGLEVLKILNHRPNKNPMLQEFIAKFADRYETQQKPLLEILDQENGIGYSDISISGEIMNGLMKSIKPLAKDKTEQAWDAMSSYLLNKVIESQRNREEEIRLEKSELLKLVNVEGDGFIQENLFVLFRVADERIFLESAGLHGAINTITRFATIDDNIKEVAMAFSPPFDEQDQPIYAEISHYPDPIMGNVLIRPRLTRYQISIVYNSAIPAEDQIPVNDLLISLRGEVLVLHSKRLKREIIPILSSAHNFHHSRNLPVYKFLCDLQLQQDKNSLLFQWPAALKGLVFFPRVVCRSSVLSLASWNFKDQDLALFIQDIKEFQHTPFMKKWGVPRKFIVSDGDNELFADLNEESSRKVILQLLSKKSAVLIKELFLPVRDTVVSGENGNTNQFTAFLKGKGNSIYTGEKTIANIPKVREFYPLSEWIYFKIYCGGTISDEILVGTIDKLTNRLLKDKLIDKWFFIRYTDPGYHIRVRLAVKNKNDIPRITAQLNRCLEILISRKKAWKIQFDTYKPEIERYHTYGMDISETAFFLSSRYTLKLLAYLNRSIGSEQQVLFLSMVSVDHILSAFNFETKEKLRLVGQFKKSMESGYKIDTDFWKKIDVQFKANKSGIAELMVLQPANGSEINKLLSNWKVELAELYKTAKATGPDLESYIFSLAHMQVNRLFKEHQKINELITYQLLSKYYSLVLYSKNQAVISP
ncbi:hypothetical protein AY601_1454 [Pedobacter cryoconitis]|uniref:Thiopeptide-type bacteriocin biosynthesis protein n=1 Tax=Pedobacter cryoconitis TaxID=188932 RepID=A0A127VB24_9SPHI|nr:lantibiotic dehydratase [Pedobacter cryoconitis]AMP98371.1 hypothetical protein AY601_1454 [Pedobacter cryoconitis]